MGCPHPLAKVYWQEARKGAALTGILKPQGVGLFENCTRSTAILCIPVQYFLLLMILNVREQTTLES